MYLETECKDVLKACNKKYSTLHSQTKLQATAIICYSPPSDDGREGYDDDDDDDDVAHFQKYLKLTIFLIFGCIMNL